MDKEFINELQNAEFVLIGIGPEFSRSDLHEENEMKINALNHLSSLLKGKLYFVLSENSDDLIFRSDLLPFFICAPYLSSAQDVSGNSDAVHTGSPAMDQKEQWTAYRNWLSGTLGHDLLILELGVGFQKPDLIRMPFEMITLINIRSRFIRVNGKLSQLTKELSDSGRARSAAVNSVDWLTKDSTNSREIYDDRDS